MRGPGLFHTRPCWFSSSPTFAFRHPCVIHRRTISCRYFKPLFGVLRSGGQVLNIRVSVLVQVAGRLRCLVAGDSRTHLNVLWIWGAHPVSVKNYSYQQKSPGGEAEAFCKCVLDATRRFRPQEG